jgi:ABC-2 type transport system ATP-binding protein
MAEISDAAIRVDNLTKSYSTGRGGEPLRALDGLSFAADVGTVFGLLGPNGAGKSTTVKILATLARADSGTATVAGIDVARHPDQVRRAIGFVSQKPVSDPMDTGLENLVLAGRLQGMPGRAAGVRAGELLERFSLTDAARRQVKTYSGGMARKLDVAMGLMHRPRVLFLDEPTTGLDPQARAEMWAEIEHLAVEEKTVILLTTHYLEEADRLASALAIVDHGRLVASGSPEELKSALRGDTVVAELANAEDIPAATAAYDRIRSVRELIVDERVVRARADVGATALPEILGALDDAGIAVNSATVARPSLEDVYLQHTGHTFASAHAGAERSVLTVRENA